MLELKLLFIHLFLIVLCLPLSSFNVVALDVVKFKVNRSDTDVRHLYNLEVLQTALEITTAEFGPYQLEKVELKIPTARLLPELVQGEIVNTAVVVSRPNWEQTLLTVRIPIRRGVLGYRLLMINKQQISQFNAIDEVNELKAKWACLGQFWSTTQTMDTLGFKYHKIYWDLSLITMLDKNRCDYIPRGVHEIYEELERYRGRLNNLHIEENIALYIPAAFYFFVSPNSPKLHKRLTAGLEKMVAQGHLQKMVEKHYRKYLTLAKLDKRKIFYLGNPQLTKDTPLQRKEFWLRWDIEEDRMSTVD